MATSIGTSPDGLSGIISINGVEKCSVDSAGKVTATKFVGDGSELTGIIKTGTAITTTAGTNHDFPIPDGIKMVTLSLDGVSTGGTGFLRFQLGSSSGIAVTGYNTLATFTTTAGSVGGGISSVGVDTSGDGAAACIRRGKIVFTNITGNVWEYSGIIGVVGSGTNFNIFITGSVTLPNLITTLRVTTTTSDTFDAGVINVFY